MPRGGGGGGSRSGGGGGRSSSGTYVNNSYNQSMGRVGMSYGTAVVSSGGGGGSSASAASPGRTYVDNTSNRSIGRVGLPVGSAVVSRSSGGGGGSSASAASPGRTYVDNPSNRNIGRVGLPVGSAVVSRSNDGGGGSSTSAASPGRTYVDNAVNRRLGRAGMPMVVSRDSGTSSMASPKKVYVDNAANRRMGRVGMPLGSMVQSQSPKKTDRAKDMARVWDYVHNDLNRSVELPTHFDDYDVDGDPNHRDVLEGVMEMVNRLRARESVESAPPRAKAFENYDGDVIAYEDLVVKEKIGHGGFGDVHVALWNGATVAVKRLRVQKVHRKRLQQFEEEVSLFFKLNHPNIIKYYGACIVTPNLAMVMELMEKCLYEVLHIEAMQLADTDKKSIIKQLASGVVYLHDKARIAHCDLKPQNILINTNTLVAKITDFGLSKMKGDADVSTTTAKAAVQNIGTPRYSAPEILRGEMIERRDLPMTDVYSLGLIVYEVWSENESFSELNQLQMIEQVGRRGLTPPLDEIPEKVYRDVVKRLLDFDPSLRPKANEFLSQIA